jgi:hypothetical protein
VFASPQSIDELFGEFIHRVAIVLNGHAAISH